MKKTLLFVREKAKNQFIKDANETLKFVNKVYNEVKKLDFNDNEAWELAGFAKRKPTLEELENKAKEILTKRAGTVELSGVKIAQNKLIDLIELPDMTSVSDLIERAREKGTITAAVPFDKIKNDKNIEIDSKWLDGEIEKFSIYTDKEQDKNTFEAFKDLVKAVNVLVSDNNQTRFFGFLEEEGFVTWNNHKYVIDTRPNSLNRLFGVFGGSVEMNRNKKDRELSFTGE